jgi:cell division protein FtsL
MFARQKDALKQKYRKLKKGAGARWETMPRVGSVRIVLVALGAFILIAIVYLAQSSNAAIIARDLRVKQLQIDQVERENAQLRYEIAALASPSAIEERARKLGLGPAKHVVYAQMPWIQPERNELMPAFLPQAQTVTAPQTFDTQSDPPLQQVLQSLGLGSLVDLFSQQAQ